MDLPAVLTEKTLTFKEAAAQCPGRAVSVKTIYSWADLGVKVGEERVKLECARVGGRRVTSMEALARFMAALSEEPVEQPLPLSPAKRRRQDAARRREAEAEVQQLLRELAEL